MKLLIETFDDNGNLNTSRTSTQNEPNWEKLEKKAKKYGRKTKFEKQNGEVVRYEEELNSKVLGIKKYIITVIEK